MGHIDIASSNGTLVRRILRAMEELARSTLGWSIWPEYLLTLRRPKQSKVSKDGVFLLIGLDLHYILLRWTELFIKFQVPDHIGGI